MGFIGEVTRDLQFILSVVRLSVGQTTEIFELLYFKSLAHSRLCTYRIVLIQDNKMCLCQNYCICSRRLQTVSCS
jgi:hypothetical protein